MTLQPPQDLLEEHVPGNIRKAEHFLQLLRGVVAHVRARLSGNTARLRSRACLGGGARVARVAVSSLRASGRLGGSTPDADARHAAVVVDRDARDDNDARSSWSRRPRSSTGCATRSRSPTPSR